MKRGYRKIFLILLFVILVVKPYAAMAQPTTNPGIPEEKLYEGLKNNTPESILEGIVKIGLKGVKVIIEGLLYVIAGIGSVLFWIGAQFINLFIDLSNEIPRLFIVQEGWKIVRDVANLGFVLVIILIALATIVRYEDYGAKKLLPKLIAAAILVNFSLTIGTIFVEFSNVLTNFFFSRASDPDIGPLGAADKIATAFAPQKLAKVDEKNLGDEGKESLAAVIGLFFAAIFTFLGALTLIGMALMLLVRMIYIAVLLVISPIIWLFWVIPQLAGEFKKWWNKFLSWVFYAPILSFFFYLTMKSVDSLTTLNKSFENKINTAYGVGINEMSNVLIDDFFSTIANMIIIIGFLVAGLLMAQSLGMTGASSMMKLAQKAGSGVKGWAAKKGKEAGSSAWRKTVTSGTDAEGKTAFERLGERYGNKKFIGRVFTGISGISSKAKAKGKVDVDEYLKKADQRTGSDALAIATRAKVMPDAEKAAYYIKAVKEGKLDEIKKKGKEEDMLNAVRKTGSGDKVLEYAPQLAPKFVERKKGESDPDYERRKKEAGQKAAAKMTDIPKNIDKGFIKENAAYLPSQLVEKFGLLPGKDGEDIRAGIQETLKITADPIIINVVDKDGKWKPKKGYEGIKNARQSVQEKDSQINEIREVIRDLRAQADIEKDKGRQLNIRRTIALETSEASSLVKQKEQQQKYIRDLTESLKGEVASAVGRLDAIAKNPNYKT